MCELLAAVKGARFLAIFKPAASTLGRAFSVGDIRSFDDCVGILDADIAVDIWGNSDVVVGAVGITGAKSGGKSGLFCSKTLPPMAELGVGCTVFIVEEIELNENGSDGIGESRPLFLS